MKKRILTAAVTAAFLALTACGDTVETSDSVKESATDTSYASSIQESADGSEASENVSSGAESENTEKNSDPEKDSEAEAVTEKSASDEEAGQEGKILVAYFTNVQTDGTDADASASRVYRGDSLVGVTEYFAQIIAEYTGGDLFLIKGGDYPADYASTTEAANQERTENARPELQFHIENLDDYDVIFVGFPTWWTDMPMAVYSFFDEYDLSGKTVIPFNTHWGCGAADTFETIAELEPDATVPDGLSIYNYDIESSENEITAWVDGLGVM